MSKEPNYGLRRGVAGTVASGIIGGLAGMAGAAMDNPARRLAEAGLQNAPEDIANHIMGTGAMGATAGALIAGGVIAKRAIQNRKAHMQDAAKAARR